MKELTQEEMLDVVGGYRDLIGTVRDFKVEHESKGRERDRERRERNSRDRARDRARERPSHEGAC